MGAFSATWFFRCALSTCSIGGAQSEVLATSPNRPLFGRRCSVGGARGRWCRPLFGRRCSVGGARSEVPAPVAGATPVGGDVEVRCRGASHFSVGHFSVRSPLSVQLEELPQSEMPQPNRKCLNRRCSIGGASRVLVATSRSPSLPFGGARSFGIVLVARGLLRAGGRTRAPSSDAMSGVALKAH
jgi:hypothetical protein